jgi:hypothetical protein
LVAFVVAVSVVFSVSRSLQESTGSRTKAILGGVLAGIAVSVFSDFTFSFATANYDRSLEAIIGRAISSGIISVMVSFFSTTRHVKPE